MAKLIYEDNITIDTNENLRDLGKYCYCLSAKEIYPKEKPDFTKVNILKMKIFALKSDIEGIKAKIDDSEDNPNLVALKETINKSQKNIDQLNKDIKKLNTDAKQIYIELRTTISENEDVWKQNIDKYNNLNQTIVDYKQTLDKKLNELNEQKAKMASLTNNSALYEKLSEYQNNLDKFKDELANAKKEAETTESYGEEYLMDNSKLKPTLTNLVFDKTDYYTLNVFKNNSKLKKYLGNKILRLNPNEPDEKYKVLYFNLPDYIRDEVKHKNFDIYNIFCDLNKVTKSIYKLGSKLLAKYNFDKPDYIKQIIFIVIWQELTGPTASSYVGFRTKIINRIKSDLRITNINKLKKINPEEYNLELSKIKAARLCIVFNTNTRDFSLMRTDELEPKTNLFLIDYTDFVNEVVEMMLALNTTSPGLYVNDPNSADFADKTCLDDKVFIYLSQLVLNAYKNMFNA